MNWLAFWITEIIFIIIGLIFGCVGTDFSEIPERVGCGAALVGMTAAGALFGTLAGAVC